MVGEVPMSGIGNLKFFLMARLVIMQMILVKNIRSSMLVDTFLECCYLTWVLSSA
jgi:hypothetical protein